MRLERIAQVSYSTAYFINEYSHHVSLTPLQESKSPAKVELHVIFLPFHTYSKKYPPLVTVVGVLKVQPYIVGQEIAKFFGVETYEGPANNVMLTHERAITYTAH
jgi:hypothetical protein